MLDQLATLNASWHAARVSAGREMLGPQQLMWLRDGIANASADAVTWQMIGQQVIVQPRNPCDLNLAVERAPTTALRHEWAATLDNLTTADYATRTVCPWDSIGMSPGIPW